MRVSIVEKAFYEKGKLLSFADAKKKALLFLQFIKLTNEDLCDYWFGLCDNWDLNIWLDVDDKDYKDEDDRFLNVTLYKVKNGNTTDWFRRILGTAP